MDLHQTTSSLDTTAANPVFQRRSPTSGGDVLSGKVHNRIDRLQSRGIVQAAARDSRRMFPLAASDSLRVMLTGVCPDARNR